jgi:psp operon transcriptional activator
VGQSESFLLFQEQLSLAARADRPVLVVGERGCGKELAAMRLHYLSARWQGPLETVNCAALPPALVESELFGHEPGAFTGAVARRVGRFEAKILRVVEQQTLERVGSSRTLDVDVRVVGATNQDLPSMAANGKFLPDLLDRLSFEVLTLPPLRERGDDVVLLAEYFAARFAAEARLAPPLLSEKAVAQLYAYDWPGNVRELKNAVERAVHRSGGGEIFEIPLHPFDSPYRPAPDPASGRPKRALRQEPQPAKRTEPANLREAVQNLEIELLQEALARARNNQRRAAVLLGLSYHQLRGMLRKYKEHLDS